MREEREEERKMEQRKEEQRKEEQRKMEQRKEEEEVNSVIIDEIAKGSSHGLLLRKKKKKQIRLRILPCTLVQNSLLSLHLIVHFPTSSGESE